MGTADDTRATLLVLRLRGAADADAIAAALQARHAAVPDLAVLLGRLALAGLVDAGPGERWRLTADGRAEGERLLAVELDAADARNTVTGVYHRFLTLNGPLLRACTDWQLRDADPASAVVNDHLDASYDRAVLDRVAAIHERASVLTAALTAALDRFGSYAERLDAAQGRIAAGDGAALDQSTDSYHGTWFELHEDLIATLGHDRSTEALPDTSGSFPS